MRYWLIVATLAAALILTLLVAKHAQTAEARRLASPQEVPLSQAIPTLSEGGLVMLIAVCLFQLRRAFCSNASGSTQIRSPQHQGSSPASNAENIRADALAVEGSGVREGIPILAPIATSEIGTEPEVSLQSAELNLAMSIPGKIAHTIDDFPRSPSNARA